LFKSIVILSSPQLNIFMVDMHDYVIVMVHFLFYR